MTATKKTGWAWALGTFFGAGYLKPGPGTYGSVAAVLLWYAAGSVPSIHGRVLAVGTAVAALIVTLVGIPVSTIVAREAGREDPGFVVIDEVAGQLLALVVMPVKPVFALLALVLFRVFDIWKPWPVRKLEALPGGTGIMLDDVAAGVIAMFVGYAILRFGNLA